MAGGNGANLARAGFAVPPGFIIPTTTYRDFVTANRLDQFIHTALVTARLHSGQRVRVGGATGVVTILG